MNPGQAQLDTPIRPGRKRKGEGFQRRDEILTAARELFLKEGVERVTIRAICDNVGITAPSLYRHYKDKRELIVAICNATFQRLLDRFRAIRAGEPDPLAALRQMMEAYVRFALEHPDEYRLLFMAKEFLKAEFDDIKSDDDAIRAGILGPLVLRELAALVAACIERGALKPGDPVVTTEILWAVGHGLAALLITHPHFQWRPREEIIQAALAMPLEGLLPR
jgi:AcrR family transcriptional regulator